MPLLSQARLWPRCRIGAGFFSGQSLRKATDVQTLKRGLTHVRERRAALALAGAFAIAIGLTSPALAAGGPPIGPVYDCYGHSGLVAEYVTALQLKSKTTYRLAPFRKGKSSLSSGVTKGTYKLRGTKLTFLTGPYRHWHGLWKLRTYNGSNDPRHISLFTPKGVDSGIECYPYPH
jgi:hypothetical protein